MCVRTILNINGCIFFRNFSRQIPYFADFGVCLPPVLRTSLKKKQKTVEEQEVRSLKSIKIVFSSKVSLGVFSNEVGPVAEQNY